MHVRVAWPGLITRFSLAPANAHELSVLPEIVEGTSGLIVGDRNYHSPKTSEELVRMGVELLAPYSSKKLDPNPKRSAFLECLPQPASLPDRHRLFAARGTLLRKAGVGARSVAPGKQAAAQSPLSHRGLPAQPPLGQPTPPALEAPHLKNPHIGLVSLYSYVAGLPQPFC
jgi:hypothetical protein